MSEAPAPPPESVAEGRPRRGAATPKAEPAPAPAANGDASPEKEEAPAPAPSQHADRSAPRAREESEAPAPAAAEEEGGDDEEEEEEEEEEAPRRRPDAARGLRSQTTDGGRRWTRAMMLPSLRYPTTPACRFKQKCRPLVSDARPMYHGVICRERDGAWSSRYDETVSYWHRLVSTRARPRVPFPRRGPDISIFRGARRASAGRRARASITSNTPRRCGSSAWASIPLKLSEDGSPSAADAARLSVCIYVCVTTRVNRWPSGECGVGGRR